MHEAIQQAVARLRKKPKGFILIVDSVCKFSSTTATLNRIVAYDKIVSEVGEKNGSPRELVITVVLRGFLRFLKSDIFGVGHGHAFCFQQQVTHVPIAATAIDQHADITVDGFDNSEAHFGSAIVQNAVEVLDQHLGELLKGGQSLPPQLIYPLPQVVDHSPAAKLHPIVC